MTNFFGSDTFLNLIILVAVVGILGAGVWEIGKWTWGRYR